MNTPRIVSMTALAASLMFVVFAITQVHGEQTGPYNLSAAAQFCPQVEQNEPGCATPYAPINAAIR